MERTDGFVLRLERKREAFPMGLKRLEAAEVNADAQLEKDLPSQGGILDKKVGKRRNASVAVLHQWHLDSQGQGWKFCRIYVQQWTVPFR